MTGDNDSSEIVGRTASADRTQRAVAALRASGGVVVIDDHDREDEGDVVFAAQTITETQLAFLMSECRGLVCVAAAGHVLDRLDLPLMVEDNSEAHRTAFTVSVDARQGISTGISAADRALTARLLGAEDSEPSDFVRPGHLFPLRAHDGGVLARRGHTEAAVVLVEMAGRGPAGVICEIADADGRMLRGQSLRKFADDHDMPVLTIEELIEAITDTSRGVSSKRQ